MAKRYVFVRMPKEIYNKFVIKKEKMEADIKQITGRNIPLTMPKVWALVSKNPVEIEFSNLIQVTKKKKRGKK